ncbi:hypothetical protein ACFE04_011084 [Oxalis oulophora]
MAEAIASFTISKVRLSCSSRRPANYDIYPAYSKSLRLSSSSIRLYNGWCHQDDNGKLILKSKRGELCKAKAALPDLPPLLVLLVEHVEGQRDVYMSKSIVHLSDQTIKAVYAFYLLFTCWGCMFFGSMKDPYYDSETYRKDGGDGTGHWIYNKQEDMEESARRELWREELIEEIEQKVGGLRELEEAVRK